MTDQSSRELREEIYRLIVDWNHPERFAYSPGETADKLAAYTARKMLELIGEDESAPQVTQARVNGRIAYDQFDDLLRPGRNDLRAELRQRVSELRQSSKVES